MLIRIVRMTFQPDKIDEFVAVFNESKQQIASFEGCQHLELLQDQDHPHIFFTYSIWQSDEHLQQYRQSQLFKGMWSKVKPLFTGKARAWSTSCLYNSDNKEK